MKRPLDDRRLREVRDVLNRLQRLDQPDAPEANLAHDRGRRFSGRTMISLGLLAMVAAGVASALYLGWLLPPDRTREARPLSPSPNEAGKAAKSETSETQPSRLAEAQLHMNAGRIRMARDILLAEVHLGSEAVAWALARCHDPNFLSQTQSPDADPDIEQAERWYRRWHELATEKGLVKDSVVLERLLKTLR